MKDCNIFSEIRLDEYKIMRKRIIECVLGTDMTLHNKQYTYIKMKYDTSGSNIFEKNDKISVFNTQQEFLNTLIHSADISNPTKPIHIYQRWVKLIMDEFWTQGDKEKNMSLPISFLCDRSTTKVPQSQLGFMDGIVFPLMEAVVLFFPNMHFLIENLNSNKAYFLKLKEEGEKSPKKI